MAQFYIRKIKRDGFALAFDYTKLKDKQLSTHTSKFCEMARKEFYDAFDFLVIGFCRGLKLVFIEREVLTRFRPVGVTYGEDKERKEYAVIVCEYTIPTTLAKVTIKSPTHYLAATRQEGELAGYWDVDTSRLLMKLREEAQLFLMGERAQGRLFDAPAKATEAEGAEGMPDGLLDEVIPLTVDATRLGGNVVPMKG